MTSENCWLGTLYPSPDEAYKTSGKVPIFLRVAAGAAKVGEGKYDCSTSATSGNSIITSKQTGRTFVLGWEEIIKLAIERGIDDKGPIRNGTKRLYC